jgi:hypothetical protein
VEGSGHSVIWCTIPAFAYKKWRKPCIISAPWMTGHRLQIWTPNIPRASQECLILFLIRIVGGGVKAGFTRHVGHGMTCPGWLWWWRIWWNKDWQGKPKYSEKTYPSSTLSNTNLTWPDPGLNPGRHGGKPATNRLSYGAAQPRGLFNRQQISAKIYFSECLYNDDISTA